MQLTPKRAPGKYRGRAANWGVVDEIGQWAHAGGMIAAFNTSASAQAWIDDPMAFGKDSITWKIIPDTEWVEQRS